MSDNVFDTDVLIIGAGLAGIGSACHLRRNDPNTNFIILESRAASGGTWDLFKYPGIRSDSDMYTYAYGFKPWKSKVSIAGGDKILSYIRDTAKEYDLDKHIRFQHKVVTAEWSSERKFWSVSIMRGDTGKTVMKGNTLPGIISFLYYTGSPLFLLISIILIFFIFNFLENFLRYFTNNNLVFVCFISNMIASRLFHFGYAPKDSYLFLISILLSILFLSILMRFKFRFSR